MISLISPVQENIETGRTIQVMAESYCEMAVSRLNRIRVKIERNRLFAQELAAAFHEVRDASSRFNFKHKIVRKPRLNVILFSNHGYFLSLETRMFDFFRKRGDEGDLVVIGRSGPEIFTAADYKKPFDILIYENDLPKSGQVFQLAARLKDYDQVSIFYPQFKTVATQVPVAFDITGDVTAIEKGDGKAAPAILEPEAPQMLEFFEGQILRLLLEQAFLEAELARTASRLLMMDNTQGRAKEYIELQDQVRRQQYKARQEVKILELSLGFLARRHMTF